MDKVVLNYANGSEQKIALIFDESTGGDGIIASEEIQSVEDLKGKKVGIDFASTEYFFLHKILMDHGMTFDDLDLQDMDASSAGASFIAGDLDAAVVWEPWLAYQCISERRRTCAGIQCRLSSGNHGQPDSQQAVCRGTAGGY